MKYKLDLKEGVDFRVKRGHWLPKKVGVECIAFGKTLYHREKDGEVPLHEFFHIAQFHRYGVAQVLLHYLFYEGKNYIRYRNFGKAFSEIPFEVEAREFEERNRGTEE